ncbi:MAG: transporter substrate-binding domain-containing protein [Olsenella sp.]|jgi:putative glutamine transport system substrate-binding protein|nr:transporter substrate-binding domain-containing protein [Olsenella sp.]MCI1289288.1 transporter substrate-binding domain-containing protein [Olsenella sp.]
MRRTHIPASDASLARGTAVAGGATAPGGRGITRRGFLSLAGAAAVALGAATSPLALAGCSSSGSTEQSLSAIRKRGHLNCGVKTDVIGYGYQDTATGKFTGMEIDICYAIAAKVFGVSSATARKRDLVNFTGVTAKTRGPLVDSGQVDLVCATYTITPERKQSWNFSDPYYTDSIGMLVLKSSGIRSVADLDGKIVGVGEGADTKTQVQAMLKSQGHGDFKVSYPQYLDYPTLAAALASGNIDVFAIDRSIIRTYVNDSNELLEPKLVFGKQQYGVCTSKTAGELTRLVNGVVGTLVSSGDIKRWAKQYKLL